MLRMKNCFLNTEFEPLDRMQRELILRVLQNSEKVLDGLFIGFAIWR